MALSLALAAPFLVGFLMIPGELVRGAYLRGAFNAAAADNAASVLAAYGFGLIPMVLIRSAVATFQSRGDTATPANCFYAGLAFNVLLKIALSRTVRSGGLGDGDGGRRVDKFFAADRRRPCAGPGARRRPAD